MVETRNMIGSAQGPCNQDRLKSGPYSRIGLLRSCTLEVQKNKIQATNGLYILVEMSINDDTQEELNRPRPDVQLCKLLY